MSKSTLSRAPALAVALTGLLAAGGGQAAPAWRGSSITVSNVVSLNTLDESAEPTYNPYYVVQTTFAPQWWLTDQLYLRGSIGFSREITDSDITTRDGETVLSDTTLGLGAQLWKIPVVGIDTAASLDVRLPTGPYSQAQTLVAAVSPAVSLRRTFPSALGFSVGYRVGMTRFFHEYTTGELDSPYLQGCRTAAVGCEPFLNTGVRNTRVRLSQSGSLSLSPWSWVSASAGATWLHDYLHPATVPAEVNFEPQAPQDTRTTLSWSLELAFVPFDALTIALGTSTTNPQRAPNGDNYDPFINRNTELALDLRLDVAALAAPWTED
ncbi:MAG: hypothetical protein H6706_28160 [Myxococcales bacterium]|nr:hypothetical protein [Myxococcales bacterium]